MRIRMYPSPLAYWKMNSADDGTDVSGNGYNLPSGMAYSPGKFGDCLATLDINTKTNGHPFGSGVMGETPFSVSLWIAALASPNAWQGLYLIDPTFPPINVDMCLSCIHRPSLGVMTASMRLGKGLNQIARTVPVSVGAHHLAMVCNGSTAKLYVDGAEVASESTTAVVDSFNSNSNLWIPGGSVDDLVILPTELTSEQVAEIASGVKPYGDYL